MKVGVLHPGAMGALVGASCWSPVSWASQGRSPETAARAARGGLVDVGHVGALVTTVDVIVSICPPHAAHDVAREVALHGFTGIYVDANAIAPALASQIALEFERFVDGSIIGPPPQTAGTTRLYLSGEDATAVAALWEGSVLEPKVLSSGVGTASALKMAYAGWTKGSAALLLAVRSYADAAGVGEDLVAEWSQSIPDLVDRVHRTARGVGPKAWRFAGEMEQIAAALAQVDLPAGFHEAAAVVYTRLAELQGMPAFELEQVLRRLTEGDER